MRIATSRASTAKARVLVALLPGLTALVAPLSIGACSRDAAQEISGATPERSGAAPGRSGATTGAARAPFVLTLVRPANPDGLFLNEDLVFYFSDDVDRASVTHASVSIRARAAPGAAPDRPGAAPDRPGAAPDRPGAAPDRPASAGREARGTLQVDGRRVRFVPAPVLAPDLSDGGYLPGQEYIVTLAGFPRPDGLRSVGGRLLARSVTWSFRAVSVAESRTGLVFDDALQGRVGVLRPFPAPVGGSNAKYVMAPGDAIYLACDKPIDPSSVHDEDFSIRVPSPSASEPASADPEDAGTRGIAVRARLIENYPQSAARPRPAGVRSSAPSDRWERDRCAALIELTPLVDRWDAPDWPQPKLRIGKRNDAGTRDLGLRDLGGQPILDLAHGKIHLVLVLPSSDPGRDELDEEFLDRHLRSPVAVPGYDGTASWDRSGRIEVRWPAAAGSGADGIVFLDGEVSRSDCNATRIEVPAGSNATLSSATGLVVLRAQGRLVVGGRITRAAPRDEKSEAAKESGLPRWEGSSANPGLAAGQTLSQWLASAREKELCWTVLVAGGDLVVEPGAEIETSTRLLLVAGGVIRVSGKVRSTAAVSDNDKSPAVWLLGDGGGAGIDRQARLAIDQPQGRNPLVGSLRLAILSAPIPSHGEVQRWIAAQARGSDESSRTSGASRGSWRVRYVREIGREPRSPADLAPVDGPQLLAGGGAIQLLFELTVEPGGANGANGEWAPPWIDSVHLAWEAPDRKAGGGGGPR